jgi:Ni,Fe-hydrogenase maturation factor
MIIYVFGNEELKEDNKPFALIDKLKTEFPKIQFIKVDPNADLPFSDENHVILIDTIQGINKITLINENDLDKLITNISTTAHDYDLGFQLKYLKKLGKLNKITIIGIPQEGEVNFIEIKSIINLIVRDLKSRTI